MGYMGLQGVTGSYKGLQGETKKDKSMFILSKNACLRTRTSPNSFSRCNLVTTNR